MQLFNKNVIQNLLVNSDAKFAVNSDTKFAVNSECINYNWKLLKRFSTVMDHGRAPSHFKILLVCVYWSTYPPE